MKSETKILYQVIDYNRYGDVKSINEHFDYEEALDLYNFRYQEEYRVVLNKLEVDRDNNRRFIEIVAEFNREEHRTADVEIGHKDYKIVNKYNAHVLFEIGVDTGGNHYLVIYGEHPNGYFCCIPNWGAGCEMAEPSDVFYNRSKLIKDTFIKMQAANAIAKAIKEADLVFTGKRDE